jgi:DNA polymerase-1
MYSVIDFETEEIVDGSGLAPVPVGVAIYYPDNDNSRYYAWGHPTENNCTVEDGIRALRSAYQRECLFHNCKFDLEVARQHLGLPYPKAYHDTMFLLYLDYPISHDLGLKPNAERLLGMPPEERDAVREWLVAKGICRWNDKRWGRFISKAPGGLVGRYAEGDVKRTWLLFDMLHPGVLGREMGPAYDRERKLVPIIAAREHAGVRIDRQRLEQDLFLYQVYYEQITQHICQVLGKDVDLDSGAALAEALLSGGHVESLPRTPKGRISVARKGLNAALRNSPLSKLIGYRGALKTLMTTFMGPWLDFSARDGRIHPAYNQVRGEEYGTRTGRLSSSKPNFQNVPNEFEGLDLDGFPLLPLMRQYVLPDADDEVILVGDFNGQEMRLLAHFAEGRLAQIYREDPTADIHEVAAQIVSEILGIMMKRKQTKIVGFSLVYGSGVPHLADGLGVEYDLARKIKQAYFKGMPGLEEFLDDVGGRSEVRTWGGRIIPVEPPRANPNGGIWSFGYKLANHLIQGTAADQTKEAIIRYNASSKPGRFFATVHDENDTSVPLAKLGEEIAVLRAAMEDLPDFDVPFKVEFKYGRNWADLTKIESPPSPASTPAARSSLPQLLNALDKQQWKSSVRPDGPTPH